MKTLTITRLKACCRRTPLVTGELRLDSGIRDVKVIYVGGATLQFCCQWLSMTNTFPGGFLTRWRLAGGGRSDLPYKERATHLNIALDITGKYKNNEKLSEDNITAAIFAILPPLATTADKEKFRPNLC